MIIAIIIITIKITIIISFLSNWNYYSIRVLYNLKDLMIIISLNFFINFKKFIIIIAYSMKKWKEIIIMKNLD